MCACQAGSACTQNRRCAAPVVCLFVGFVFCWGGFVDDGSISQGGDPSRDRTTESTRRRVTPTTQSPPIHRPTATCGTNRNGVRTKRTVQASRSSSDLRHSLSVPPRSCMQGCACMQASSASAASLHDLGCVGGWVGRWVGSGRVGVRGVGLDCVGWVAGGGWVRTILSCSSLTLVAYAATDEESVKQGHKQFSGHRSRWTLATAPVDLWGADGRGLLSSSKANETINDAWLAGVDRGREGKHKQQRLSPQRPAMSDDARTGRSFD